MHQHWPQLSYEKAKDTYHTIHLWTQIVGKIKGNYSGVQNPEYSYFLA